MLLSLLALVAGCAPRPGSPPQTALPPPLQIDTGSSTRILLVGDTGVVTGKPLTESCDQRVDGKITADETVRDALMAQMKAEQADAIIALGDLVYPESPECPADAMPPSALEPFDRYLGDYLGKLGAPVLLVLGNHDTGHEGEGNAGREACFRHYAARHPELVLPERNYVAHLGPVRLGVIDTNRLPGPALTKQLSTALSAEPTPTWTVLAGHHVLRTFHNKEQQDVVMPWLSSTGLVPDLYANGHAHLLQHGVYDVAGQPTPAATSGTGAKVRCRPECDPASDERDACGTGQTFGRSRFGYALLEADARSLRVRYKDHTGAELYCWERDTDDRTGRTCP